MNSIDSEKLDQQRTTYTRFIGTLNKVAAGVGDGTLKGEAVRDMLLILQARFLVFILSELVHLSDRLRILGDQDRSKIEDKTISQIDSDMPDEELEELSVSNSEYERGSTDLLGRFQGLGLVADEGTADENASEESVDEISPKPLDKKLGGTARLISALAEIESAGTTEDAQKIVDEIYELAERLEDDDAD